MLEADPSHRFKAKPALLAPTGHPVLKILVTQRDDGAYPEKPIAQSVILEAMPNIPTTAHILGGSVIGQDVTSGGIDRAVTCSDIRSCWCATPAQSWRTCGQTSLTITAAIAEHAMGKTAAAVSELAA